MRIVNFRFVQFEYHIAIRIGWNIFRENKYQWALSKDEDFLKQILTIWYFINKVCAKPVMEEFLFVFHDLSAREFNLDIAH